ncbi:MAG TPA: hypothetical protein VHA56_14215 [Mucilaginibacter sp.]|nr:hypothetical protein [Mucilaginibacter sp.]
MRRFKYLLFVVALFYSFSAAAQRDTTLRDHSAIKDSSNQRDAIDLVKKFLNRSTPPDSRKTPKKLIFAVVPAAGYSLSTGFALAVVSNLAFYTSSSHNENLSEIGAEVFYDTKAQKVFRSRSEIWADKNNYKLVTDLRWERYPEDIYGLGTKTTFATLDKVDYLYLRTYATLFKKIIPDLYGGIGYNLDHHYRITESGNADNSTSDFQRYGFTTSSTSSGINLDLLYDSRRNPINPLGGGYASVIYRDNFKAIGSDGNWRGIQIDLRKYIRLSANSNSVLAFWSIVQFTSGDVPFLDLPGTGTDMYSNAGRGYARNRFKGRNELYLEGEYRFGITANGLIGAVVFANAESFSELQSNRFEKIAPAAGSGIRVKINKHSDTNICIDYGIGTGGSHGFFVSLGEVF